ncbi:MAG: LytTR family DNA-binding domain-containing protein [Saprospiraceae bacterium]|jgi:two-component system LytT family response regulator|nr:LytTR family DNA-binding domain-containing protein [Saprospiraceae bacterium]MDP5000170.1 LytTR family DNA-binding domain-containing protein [Saprospiraceae bacterium]
MKAIIIEDEQSASENLIFLLQALAPDIQILELIETVSDAISFFKENNAYDLVFMDIHLADGNSFEIVKEVEPRAPIIFTTAYDQYAIQAFKLNSIDYLLKPIREAELKNAILKYKDKHRKTLVSAEQIEALMSLMTAPKKTFRSSFLVQRKDVFIPIVSSDFAFFFIQDGVVRGTTTDNQTYSFKEKLEDLESDLDPELFFRVNRQYLIQRAAIKSLQTYFNGRLVVHLKPQEKDKIVVSKANASRLKAWLE